MTIVQYPIQWTCAANGGSNIYFMVEDRDIRDFYLNQELNPDL